MEKNEGVSEKDSRKWTFQLAAFVSCGVAPSLFTGEAIYVTQNHILKQNEGESKVCIALNQHKGGEEEEFDKGEDKMKDGDSYNMKHYTN